jgi:cytoskeletal protein RodZ
MRTKKIIWIVFALILGAIAVFWWTTIKEKIVKNAVTKAVQKKTDSLYHITYEKSEIDEVAGNAYLYNVQVKIDSLQWPH